MKKLVNSAGNLHQRQADRCSRGQQPFGGARGSGTNDKAGAKVNLMRGTDAHYQGDVRYAEGIICIRLGEGIGRVMERQ